MLLRKNSTIGKPSGRRRSRNNLITEHWQRIKRSSMRSTIEEETRTSEKTGRWENNRERGCNNVRSISIGLEIRADI